MTFGFKFTPRLSLRGLIAITSAVVATAGSAVLARAEDTASQAAVARISVPFEEGMVTTNDGARIHYIEAGAGQPIILIPAWSQSAMEWKFQIDEFSKHYHVFALDMRGHGKSDKPDHGYRIARLAQDLHDFIAAKNLTDVVLDGHSMGCSVIWSYLEQFGQGGIKKLVLTDQMPVIVANPAWSEQERKDAGSVLEADKVQPLLNALAGPDSLNVTTGFVHQLYPKDYPKADFDYALEQNLLIPREYAARMLYDHAFKDWRDVIRHITLPTLAIGAKASFVPYTSMVWVGQAIKGVKTVIFEENEGGSHFMVSLNPTKYNQVVEDFLADNS